MMGDSQERDESQTAAAGGESGTETASADMPSTAELEDPSTEKDPGEEPRAAGAGEPEVDHEAVGIGVVGRPQVDPQAAGR